MALAIGHAAFQSTRVLFPLEKSSNRTSFQARIRSRQTLLRFCRHHLTDLGVFGHELHFPVV